ncbi:Predicted pyrophosphatase or phosphodiesterase, AlkP superfamily [Fontibacillus panacisegetis]|uniref:Predicted pyrophosphatase or phosphodiesterase, AlkP superfamily n=1 Tax=Fontibacillus panacisegetis TaxID=670482 RepID=A0A1G7GDT1_9BACL|nr:alkaline phosphatase family protein [Fontibacillus panacisegetis]SDE86286.1 Predicted pyrophosphatase or phosphodiesterase, AlkP superfamily [Fontibacillus panacisegetis]
MLKIIRFLYIAFIFILVLGCQRQDSKANEQDLFQVKSVKDGHSKKIIFLLIDSLMSQAIDQGIKQKELPAFQYLINHGQYNKNMVSSFPTMSVTIDSSLLTGSYPNENHVPGLTWFSSDTKKVINYGTGPMEVLRHGVDPTLVDGLIHLNNKHLNPKLPTIYEDLAKRGLKAGSINGLIYRGSRDHKLSIPAWIHGPTSLPKEIPVQGPDFLALGSLTNPLKGIKNLPDDITRRIGINNQYSIETVKHLIQANKLPDFLFVYLPDLDQKIHKDGPPSLNGVKEVDQQLHSLLRSFPSPEEALKEVIFIIAGDSGMTRIFPAEKNPVIDLPSMFKGYNVLSPGENVTDKTEIVLAVNETMAYVYKLNRNKSLQDIARLLTTDPRIDFVSWKENEWMYAVQGATAKMLQYKADGKIKDHYQQKWAVKGDLGVLDLKVNAVNNSIVYGLYPDVLERLSGALHSHKGEFLVVTAKPGYELADQSSPTHKGGGGHGSIRQEESLVPLIICGTDQKPQYLRIIDLKAFLLKLLSNSK